MEDGAAMEKAHHPVWCVCKERPAAEHRMSAEPEVAHGISQFTLKLLYCSEIIALVTFVVQPSFSDEFPWTD